MVLHPTVMGGVVREDGMMVNGTPSRTGATNMADQTSLRTPLVMPIVDEAATTVVRKTTQRRNADMVAGSPVATATRTATKPNFVDANRMLARKSAPTLMPPTRSPLHRLLMHLRCHKSIQLRNAIRKDSTQH